MQIALCQVNATVASLEKNVEIVLEAINEATTKGAELAIFPELTLLGCAAKELVQDKQMVADCLSALEKIAVEAQIACVIGTPIEHEGVIKNAAVFIDKGSIREVVTKRALSDIKAIREQDLFAEGSGVSYTDFIDKLGKKVKIAIGIGDDLFTQKIEPVDLAINCRSDIWNTDYGSLKKDFIFEYSKYLNATIAVCNQVGGMDELVYAGSSFVVAPKVGIIATAESFKESIMLCDTSSLEVVPAKESNGIAALWSALCLSVKDFVTKSGFTSVIVGLSGGIDGALVAAIAVDALGHENVRVLTMPSRFSSEGTLRDAHQQAESLGVLIDEIKIDQIVDTFEHSLTKVFAGLGKDVTEENIQARVRGSLLMAMSNKYKCLLLNTGNRSEGAVGYCTLYGDSCGSFAPLKEISKTLVYKLANWRNAQALDDGKVTPIPQSIIDREPTAELRPDQLDSDSLPKYEDLDHVLELIIDKGMNKEEIVNSGVSIELADKVYKLFRGAEYKRYQSAPGPLLTASSLYKIPNLPLSI